LTPTSPAIRLRPPDFTLKGKSSTAAAIQGAYYWQLANGLAVDVKSGGFSISGVTPMDVTRGEQLNITAANGPYPDKLDVKIYKQDGNLTDATTATGTLKAFHVNTDPVSSKSFTNTPYQLTADVPPGDYFIWLGGTWSNSFKRPASSATVTGTPTPIRPLTDEVAFWIHVQ